MASISGIFRQPGAGFCVANGVAKSTASSQPGDRPRQPGRALRNGIIQAECGQRKTRLVQGGFYIF